MAMRRHTLKAMLLLEGDVHLQAAPAGADRSPAGILLSSAAESLALTWQARQGAVEPAEGGCAHVLSAACEVYTCSNTLRMQELPAHVWTLLAAQAHDLKLKVLSATLNDDGDLQALRQHVAGVVEYIQHGEDHGGLSAAF